MDVRPHLIEIFCCRQIITELIDTEKDYVKKLGHVRMVSIVMLDSLIVELFLGYCSVRTM